MTIARLIRSVAVSTLIALGASIAFDAIAQSNYDDSTGQTPTPGNTERGSGASDRSRDQGNTPSGSQGSNIRSGTETDRERAAPRDSSRGGPSSAPNCPTMPPNGAECPSQGR